MLRRQFLTMAAGCAATAACGWPRLGEWFGPQSSDFRARTSSVIPVVGDGHWIWTKPPADATGYLEPRPYELRIGIEMTGRGSGNATDVRATTPVPVEHPEQKIEDLRLETEGCTAKMRELAPGAGQLTLAAATIAPGQVISAIAHYRLTLSKQYHGYTRDKFPAAQRAAADVRKAYLQDSPGIQTSSKLVQALAHELSSQLEHPWDRAAAFCDWVPQHIQPQIGSYTSVTTALETRRGDCEEMAGVFVALCRAVDIPARLVWVPNHTWAEFHLTDHDGGGHWIPAHTACYPWFGWNGAHELVLQKGDRVYVPEQHKRLRLLEDWAQWRGRQPQLRYVAELVPLPPTEGEDPGPGQRTKDASGEWKLTGQHALDRYLRR